MLTILTCLNSWFMLVYRIGDVFMNFNDNEFTLMSKYQVENGIFNEIGYQCTVSDFAIMLGLVPYGAPGGISLKDRTGGWFLKDA